MTISELIEQLEEFKKQFGNLSVCYNDNEYGATEVTYCRLIKKGNLCNDADSVLVE